MLKFQFVQFGPSRLIRAGLASVTARSRFTNGRYWQTATFRVTQRMPWKLEQNILPHIRRQVHTIVNRNHAIFPLQGQMTSPTVEFKTILEGLEAADALAIQVQKQSALHEQPV